MAGMLGTCAVATAGWSPAGRVEFHQRAFHDGDEIPQATKQLTSPFGECGCHDTIIILQ